MDNNEKLDSIIHGPAGILSGLDTKGVYYEKPFPQEEYYSNILKRNKIAKVMNITIDVSDTLMKLSITGSR